MLFRSMLIDLQKPGEAVAVLERAVALKPDYAKAHLALGMALKTIGRMAEATAALRRASQSMDNFTDALFQLGNILKDQGRIVNISSAGTKLRYHGATAYLGSRGALEQFTQGIAQELAPRGITVNTVAPGFTDTGILTDTYKQMGITASPFKRLGQPADIAGVVVFLVSEQARWITGQTIQAGGGVVM